MNDSLDDLPQLPYTGKGGKYIMEEQYDERDVMTMKQVRKMRCVLSARHINFWMTHTKFLDPKYLCELHWFGYIER